MAVKICLMCGSEFDRAANAKYCSNRCKGRHFRANGYTATPQIIHRRKKEPENMAGIREDDAKAQALGLTYGVYKGLLTEGVLNVN